MIVLNVSVSSSSWCTGLKDSEISGSFTKGLKDLQWAFEAPKLSALPYKGVHYALSVLMIKILSLTSLLFTKSLFFLSLCACCMNDSSNWTDVPFFLSSAQLS